MSLSNDSNMVMPVTPAYGMGGYGNGMWGGGWDSWILLFLIFGMFGRGGWGGWGNESNCCAPATCADLQRGFDNQGVTNKLNGLENGLCSLGYDQLREMNGINTSILNGFHGVDNAVCQLGNHAVGVVVGVLDDRGGVGGEVVIGVTEAALDLALSLAAAGINLTANVVEALEGVVVYTINAPLNGTAALLNLISEVGNLCLNTVESVAKSHVCAVESAVDRIVQRISAVTNAMLNCIYVTL